MKYLIPKRTASSPSGRNHCWRAPPASLCTAAASSYLLRPIKSGSQTCVNDAIQRSGASNKLPAGVERCVSSHRGLTRIPRATSRLRPWMGVAVTKRLARRFRLSGSPDVSMICRRRATTCDSVQLGVPKSLASMRKPARRTTASCCVEKRRSIHLRND
jgi:hypothetical protein